MNQKEYNKLEKKQWNGESRLYSESENISFDDEYTLFCYCSEYGCDINELMLTFQENGQIFSAIVHTNTWKI